MTKYKFLEDIDKSLYPNDCSLILESSYESKPVIVSDKPDVTVFKAIIQEAELPNRNKRIYAKKALDEALNRSMIKEKMENKTFYGEAGHPMEDTMQRQTYIDQRNIALIITEFHWEGNLLWATIETANTAAGRDFQGLIRQGSKVSFSMRGVGGKVGKKDGYDYVDKDLYIIAYDWVVFPSHQKAYMKDIIKEDANGYKSVDLNHKSVLENGIVIPLNKKYNRITEYVESNRRKKKVINESYTNDIFVKDMNKDVNMYNEDNNRQMIDDYFKYYL